MASNFKDIREWDGSQHRSFEELCYQLRDDTPAGARLVKTGDPDSGLEWYVRLRNDDEWGWQAKYCFEIATLLKLMEASLKTVVSKRPRCRRLTFCIPFDLPDARVGKEQKSARQKFEDRKKSWRRRIPGADRVAVNLVSAGGLLDRLTQHPNERGIRWFFWNEEVFSNDWLAKRVAETTDAAGHRYERKLHVELPVAFALEGLAGTDLFWQRYRERHAKVVSTARQVTRCKSAGIGVTPAMRSVRTCVADWANHVPVSITPQDRLPRQHLLDLSRALEGAMNQAYPDPPPERAKMGTEKQAELDRRRRDLRRSLDRLSGALDAFVTFLGSGAAEAAAQGALVLTGEAGQGKTHLLCDAAERALAGERPALVLLGAHLSGRRFWSDCAEILGLAQIGGEALLGAMRSAAEASGKPFLLLVDALNESAEPSAWSDELPRLLAAFANDPWISFGVSVRSSFKPVVLPTEGLGDRAAEVRHPGFAGRELEATGRFFEVFELDLPPVPLLTPEFTNPLFLKLYCEGLKDLGGVTPPAGAGHVSDVFARHLELRSRRITSSLDLDPRDHAVKRAIERFSEELASRSAEHLPRREARDLVNSFGPVHHRWQRTLFGQLLSEGLLASDVAWSRESGELVEVVRFVYQRFADYRIADALLEPHADDVAFRSALVGMEKLRERIRSAPAGWIDALSVLVPERLGIELLDAVDWQLDPDTRQQWERALIRSIVARRPDAMTDRAHELARSAETKSRLLADEAFDAVLAVAPVPNHPLNADHLHRKLLAIPMPDRDARWGRRTFYTLDDEGALDRLIRWAARGPYPDAASDVLRLAGTLLVWTFTSPNRFLRDYATKSLRQLLDGRLEVVEALVRQFAECDDIYVLERLAAVAHGCILTAGERDHQGALSLARAVRDRFLNDERIPNVLLRDAVRGSFEWARRHDLVDAQEYEAVCPPYGSSKPDPPATKEQLEETFGLRRRDAEGNFIASPFVRIFYSVFDFGDFGRYVIQGKLHEFTDLPLDRPLPASEGRLAANRENYYSSELGQRWVFERVLALGWTPERFAAFEDRHLRDDGRRSHKAERFGKKYQWIALRELLARVADNFHMTGEWSGTERSYRGPWQFHGRDIDPTLPPPMRYRDNEDDVVRNGPTFADDAVDAWWGFGGPRYLSSDPAPEEDWASAVDDVPSFDQLVRKTDADGAVWIVLQGYGKWEEERVGDSYWWESDGLRRDLWSHVFSWIVRADDLPGLVDFLKTRSFEGRWMPEPSGFSSGAYLGEMPWASAANEYPRAWEAVGPAHDDQSESRVLPAWEHYGWEGEGFDCSIAEGASASLPARRFFEQDDLRWVAGTRTWQDRRGAVVAQHRSLQNEHQALLVRETWLKTALATGGWALVLGRLGEKTLFTRGISPDIVGDWAVLSDLATFDQGGLRLINSSTATRQPAR